MMRLLMAVHVQSANFVSSPALYIHMADVNMNINKPMHCDHKRIERSLCYAYAECK